MRAAFFILTYLITVLSAAFYAELLSGASVELMQNAIYCRDAYDAFFHRAIAALLLYAYFIEASGQTKI